MGYYQNNRRGGILIKMSDSISAMPLDIANWLNEQTEAFSDILFVTEFPPVPKATPLHRTVVSVGLENVKISDYFVENSEGELVPAEYCRLAEIKLRFSIYVPYSSGGTACHEAFTRIVDCLNFKSDLNLKNSTCQPINSDRETDAFVMKSFIDIEAQFCPAESGDIQYESFLPKTFFCGSHINDSSKHLSPGEREKWNSSIVTGTYFGTDEASVSFSLGFKPRIVIVSIINLPLFYTQGTASYCLAGIATPNCPGAGVEITENGFRIIQNSSQNNADTYTKLNRLGYDYNYIAIK